VAKTVTVVQPTKETIWTPEKRIQFRIGIIRLWMNDCNEKSKEGRKVYYIFDVYLRSLQRQLNPSRPGAVEYNQMKAAIESIHEIIGELSEAEMEALYGWSFGQKVTNSAQGLMAIVLAIRQELLMEITDSITH
jgi:hypothetical protein